MSGFPEVHRPGSDVAGPPLVMLHGGNAANWTWEPQVAVLTDRLVVTPDLPGFGERVREGWPGLDAVADDVVARVGAHGVEGPFDLVGLSLGAVTAVRVLARHPDRVRSAFLTGAPLARPGLATRLVAQLQLVFWRAPWFWRALAAGMGLPEDSRERYVAHGLSVGRETATAMIADVYAGGVPAGAGDYTGPLLAVAGAKEDAVVRRSLVALARVAPQAQLGLVPGRGHVWNVDGTGLFDEVLRSWLGGTVDERLVVVHPGSGSPATSRRRPI